MCRKRQDGHQNERQSGQNTVGEDRKNINVGTGKKREVRKRQEGNNVFKTGRKRKIKYVRQEGNQWEVNQAGAG